MAKNLIQKGFSAAAAQLNDFGYNGITAIMIEECHAAWLTGKDIPHGVIGQFAIRDFEQYPEIFGRKPK